MKIKLWCGEGDQEYWGEVLFINIKEKSFLSSGLIGQKNGVSDNKAEMQKSGKLRIVGVSGVFL